MPEKCSTEMMTIVVLSFVSGRYLKMPRPARLKGTKPNDTRSRNHNMHAHCPTSTILLPSTTTVSVPGVPLDVSYGVCWSFSRLHTFVRADKTPRPAAVTRRTFSRVCHANDEVTECFEKTRTGNRCYGFSTLPMAMTSPLTLSTTK